MKKSTISIKTENPTLSLFDELLSKLRGKKPENLSRSQDQKVIFDPDDILIGAPVVYELGGLGFDEYGNVVRW